MPSDDRKRDRKRSRDRSRDRDRDRDRKRDRKDDRKRDDRKDFMSFIIVARSGLPGFGETWLARDDLNLEVDVMIEEVIVEMIVEEVDHAIEIEETIVSIMMDTIAEVVGMMIVEGLILKIYENIEFDF